MVLDRDSSSTCRCVSEHHGCGRGNNLVSGGCLQQEKKRIQYKIRMKNKGKTISQKLPPAHRTMILLHDPWVDAILVIEVHTRQQPHLIAPRQMSQTDTEQFEGMCASMSAQCNVTCNATVHLKQLRAPVNEGRTKCFCPNPQL